MDDTKINDWTASRVWNCLTWSIRFSCSIESSSKFFVTSSSKTGTLLKSSIWTLCLSRERERKSGWKSWIASRSKVYASRKNLETNKAAFSNRLLHPAQRWRVNIDQGGSVVNIIIIAIPLHPTSRDLTQGYGRGTASLQWPCQWLTTNVVTTGTGMLSPPLSHTPKVMSQVWPSRISGKHISHHFPTENL